MATMTTDETNLVSLVRSKRPYQLLHVLKQTRRQPQRHQQQELDAALHEAASIGHVLCANILLVAGANMQSLNQYGESLLVEVAYSEEPALLEFLLQKGYDVNHHTGDSITTGMAIPLHIAVGQNMVHMTELLLSAGINTEYRNGEGNTALATACHTDNVALINMLLDAKCAVNASGSGGNTALHQAVDRGYVDSTRLLLRNGADPNVQNDESNTAIHVACDSGSEGCATLLINCDRTDMTRTNREDKNCLHFAAATGNKTLVSMLLKCGVPRDRKDFFGNTPLIIATFMRNTGFAAELLSAEPVPAINAEGEKRRTALHWACHHGLEQVVGRLLACQHIDVDLRDQDGDTPLILAAKTREVPIAEMLIAAGCDVSTRGERGRSAVHWAAVHGLVGLAEALLRVSGSVAVLNARDDDGNTPLLLAAILRHYIEMRALLRHGAVDVAAAGEAGRTALHWVCMRGYGDMVQHLLARAVDTRHARDAFGDSPLILASKHRNENVIRELIDAAVDTNAAGYLGRTALHYACANNTLSTVRILLAVRETSVNIRDDLGNTPLVVAAAVASEALIKQLVETNSCDVSAVGEGGKTALLLVAERGLDRSCRLLLECGAQTDNDTSGESALQRAARHGYAAIAQRLLKSKAVVDRVDVGGRTALMCAARGGFVDIVRGLVLHGADVRRQSAAGDTALGLAAGRGHVDVLRALAPFSDLDHRDGERQATALHLAVTHGHAPCTHALLALGARLDVPDATGNSVLLTAAIHAADSRLLAAVLAAKQAHDVDGVGEKGRAAVHWLVGEPACLRALLAHGPALDTPDENGASALLLAIAHRQPASARLLIEANCDINMLHQDGRRPIHHAAIYGDNLTTTLLLDKGVGADTETDDGRTPLLLAAIEGHVDVTRQLVVRTRQLNRVYCAAMTALSMAATNRHYGVMSLLLDAGAKPDVIGEQKHRPLMSCILNNDCAGAVLLIRAGASLSALNSEKQHPLELAVIKGYNQLIRIIAIADCDTNSINKLLKQGLLYYFITDDDLLQQLKMLSKTPPSLQMCARKVVHNAVRTPIQIHVQQLPIPMAVRDFLTMQELGYTCT